MRLSCFLFFPLNWSVLATPTLMPLHVAFDHLQPAVAAGLLHIAMTLKMLLKMVPPLEGLLTLPAFKQLAAAARQSLLIAVDLRGIQWPRQQRQTSTQEAKKSQQRIGHLLAPKFNSCWWKGPLHSRFIRTAARKDGEKFQIVPPKLSATFAGVDIAPKACGYPSPWAGAGVTHLDVWGTNDLKKIQHDLNQNGFIS